jgi:hypothetical protein
MSQFELDIKKFQSLSGMEYQPAKSYLQKHSMNYEKAAEAYLAKDKVQGFGSASADKKEVFFNLPSI